MALVGAALVIHVAVPQFLQAFAALILLTLPIYLIVWPLLQPRLGSAGAFTIAGGLSIGMVAIAGLVLNLLPWGLQAASWLSYVIVILVIALALGRRPDAWRPGLGVVRHEVVLVAIGGVMMISALLLARMFAADPVEAFTQLWITPSAVAPASSVDVSIRSEEPGATTYRLEVRRDGALVESWADIELAAGETWSTTLAVGSGRIEARLYRLAGPGTIYRRVTLQLGGTVEAVRERGA